MSHRLFNPEGPPEWGESPRMTREKCCAWLGAGKGHPEEATCLNLKGHQDPPR